MIQSMQYRCMLHVAFLAYYQSPSAGLTADICSAVAACLFMAISAQQTTRF